MKIVSLNLWNGGRLFDEIEDFLLGQKADIYVLQEAYNGRETEIRQFMEKKGLKGPIEKRFRTVEILSKVFANYQTSFAGFYLDTREKEGGIEDGQLVISRFPIKYKKMIYFDIPYDKFDHDAMTDFRAFPAGAYQVAIALDEDGRSFELNLLNVHGPWNPKGREDDKRRLTMQKVLLNNVREHTVLVGDFNVQPETKTIRGLEKNLTNVFKDQMITSFNLKRKDLVQDPGFSTAVVDMMFVTDDIKVKSKSVPKVDVSDHLPLVAELKIT